MTYQNLLFMLELGPIYTDIFYGYGGTEKEFEALIEELRILGYYIPAITNDDGAIIGYKLI